MTYVPRNATYNLALLEPAPSGPATGVVLCRTAEAPQRHPAMILTAVRLELCLARRVGNEASHFTVCRDLQILGTSGVAKRGNAGTGMTNYSAEISFLILTKSIPELIEDLASQGRGSSDVSRVPTFID